jgi:hypothetical protein
MAPDPAGGNRGKPIPVADLIDVARKREKR